MAVPSPKLLADLRLAFAARSEIRLALLFGSQARGVANAHSDLDLAVEGDGLDLLSITLDASRATGLEAHVSDLGAAGYPLLKALLRDSIVVHEGQRHAAARWRTRAILQVEMDRVWFERMRDAYLARLAGEATRG